MDIKKGADGAFFDLIQKENCFDMTGIKYGVDHFGRSNQNYVISISHLYPRARPIQLRLRASCPSNGKWSFRGI
jgi:hypothetical protein